MFNYEIIDEFTTINGIHQRRYEYDGMFHRLYGAAYLEWSDDGLPIAELWYHSGAYHRFNAPAGRWWFTNGDLADEQYFIYGHDIYSAEVMILAEKMGITDMFNLTMAEANVLMLALKNNYF